MPVTEGFVVVLKSKKPAVPGADPRYRGVDRLVPWNWSDFERGFEDPYLSKQYTTDEGFIINLSLAREVLKLYSSVIDPEELEIIYVRPAPEDGTSAPLPVPMSVLGFDVAGNMSPFYSIVYDWVPPADTEFDSFWERLNDNGLFDSPEDARAFLTQRLERYSEYRDQGIVVLEVLGDVKET